MNLNPTVLNLLADARIADDHAARRTRPERGSASAQPAPRRTFDIVTSHYVKRLVGRLFPA